MISLTLTLTALIVYLVRIDDPPPHDPTFNRALDAFCSVNSDPPSCFGALIPKIAGKSVSDPNQIFAISLQSAAEDLQVSIDLLTLSGKLMLSNCSDLLRDGLGQIRDPIAAMRVDPFVESKSDEQRGEMMSRIVAAEGDLEECLADLAGIGDGIGEALVEAKAHLNGAGDFLIGYAEALQSFEADRGSHSRWWWVIYLDVPGIGVVGMCGSQLLFMICLFCCLFRIKCWRKF